MAGVEVDRRTLQAQLAQERAALAAWSAHKSDRVQALVSQELAMAESQGDLSTMQLLARRLHEARERRRLRATVRSLQREERARMAEMEKMLAQQQRLARQIRSLQAARSLMGLWHTAHVPLGLVLFLSVALHIVATLYFGAGIG
jgi:hypothetical protein